MSLRTRIELLERDAGGRGACPACESGPERIILLPMSIDGRQAAPPAAGPCPACGRVPDVIRLLPMRFDGGKESATP